MHIDTLTIKANGKLHLDVVAYLNTALATTMTGATVSGSVVSVKGPEVTLSLDINPGAPLTLAADQVDTKGNGGKLRSE